VKRRFWSAEELDYLRLHYPETSSVQIAKALDRTITMVYGAANKLGLRKTKEFRSSIGFQKGQCLGEAYWFKKGQVPVNKGLRRPGWAPGRMAESQFKKGQLSGRAARNWRPIGTILTDTEGYLRIKVREAQHGKEATGFGNTKVWPLLSRHLWQAHHGAIPAGHVVVYKDGNRANCTIENLELVSRAELARRNRMWNNLPRELAEVIQLNGVLKRKLREGKSKADG